MTQMRAGLGCLGARQIHELISCDFLGPEERAMATWSFAFSVVPQPSNLHRPVTGLVKVCRSFFWYAFFRLRGKTLLQPLCSHASYD